MTVRPLRRDAQRNQELVLAAARAVISEHGTDAGMEQIAARAGVGVGTVYRRYPNKEALVDELVRIILTELITSARTALARGDGTGLEAYLYDAGRSLVTHRGYAGKLVSGVRDEGAGVLFGLFGDLLAQAQAHGRVAPEVTADDVRAVVWALRGIVESGGDTDAWERHLRIHLAGLRVSAAAPRSPA